MLTFPSKNLYEICISLLTQEILVCYLGSLLLLSKAKSVFVTFLKRNVERKSIAQK